MYFFILFTIKLWFKRYKFIDSSKFQLIYIEDKHKIALIKQGFKKPNRAYCFLRKFVQVLVDKLTFC
jgi:hypothetical protein